MKLKTEPTSLDYCKSVRGNTQEEMAPESQTHKYFMYNVYQ